MNTFTLFSRNIVEPTDYFKGISSGTQYNPENLVFFSRYNTAVLSECLPIVHYRFNLVFCLEGSLQIHIDNCQFTIEEGESLLIFPFQNHYYVSEEDSDILCSFIGFDMQERSHLEILRNRPVKISEFVFSCLDQIVSASDDFKVSLLTNIILSTLESCSKKSILINNEANDTMNSLVAEVQKYVYADLSRVFTTALISRELGISESNLHKQFKRAIGISPGRYIREVKINYACSILESRDFSVTETAVHCGFDSVYSFSRTFKKVTGYSPSQFRERGH